MQQFGWHYTAEEIAQYLRIGLEAVWELPTIEAVNAMSYLKAKSKYLAELQKNS